jgi:hypothetical protein
MRNSFFLFYISSSMCLFSVTLPSVPQYGHLFGGSCLSLPLGLNSYLHFVHLNPTIISY